MNTIKAFRQFYLILLPYINLPMNSAEVQIALKMMTPILNTKFYVMCDISVSTEKEDEVFLDKEVIIEDKNIKCTMTDWKFCNKAAPPQVNGACGCDRKRPLTDGFQYQFYLLVDPVTEAFIGSQFICQLHTTKDTRQMEVVMFTKQPERTLYTCKNTSVLFEWEFSPSRESIISRFHVIHISWTSAAQGKPKEALGTYYLTEDGKNHFSNDKNPRSSVSYETGKIPKLNVSNLQLTDSKQFININVTFNLTKMLERGKRFIPTTTEFLSFDSSNETDGRGEVTDDYDLLTVATKTASTTQRSTTKLTTIAKTRPTQHASTTPKPLEMTLDNPENHMVDKVYLSVTEPPSHETKVTIKAYESLTGNLVITCQTHHMDYHGEPPVNVTIWHDGKLLITRSGITVLHYSTVKEGKFISCGLEGHALDCLEKGDPRIQQDTFDLKDLEKSEKPAGGVDLLLSLYAWESILCLVLVFWAISLLLDHILFVVRKAKRELEEKNKSLLEAEMARPIVLARIRGY
ncbi:hypothetical protein BsWGS_14220 [Bradybaena similaris]